MPCDLLELGVAGGFDTPRPLTESREDSTMTDSIQTARDSEFVLRLDLGNVPSSDQQAAVIQALRKVADSIEEHPMAGTGQVRGGRRSFDALGVGARWTWQA